MILFEVPDAFLADRCHAAATCVSSTDERNAELEPYRTLTDGPTTPRRCYKFWITQQFDGAVSPQIPAKGPCGSRGREAACLLCVDSLKTYIRSRRARHSDTYYVTGAHWLRPATAVLVPSVMNNEHLRFLRMRGDSRCEIGLVCCADDPE